MTEIYLLLADMGNDKLESFGVAVTSEKEAVSFKKDYPGLSKIKNDYKKIKIYETTDEALKKGVDYD